MKYTKDLIDILSNSMESYNKSRFIDLGTELGHDNETMLNIYNAYWSMDSVDRLKMDIHEWNSFLLKYGIRESVDENLEDEATLDKIRYFRGTFQDLKTMMDRKAKKNTNAMDDVQYKYPNPRKATGTSPVYQTFGIVNNPKEMKNLHTFESFNEEYYVMGFGAPGGMGQPGTGGASPAGYGLGWPDYRSYTGYTMTPVTGIINELSDVLSKEAISYDMNKNPEHTKKSYLKEAHSYIMSGLKKCYKQNGVDDDNWDLNEENLFEFDAIKKNQTIKERNARNKKRLEVAKAKGDKNGQKLYQLKIELDQLDLQKTELKDEINKLQNVRSDDREKIKRISK